MNEQILVYPYKRMLFSNQNKLLIQATTWMNLKIITLVKKRPENRSHALIAMHTVCM